MTATCPWCNAPRVNAASCPGCGANYAKAEMIKTQGKAVAIPLAVPEASIVFQESPVEDPVLEFKLCVAAIPAALLLGALFHYLTPGLQRIVFGMPLHELGHAAAAWFCGHWAIPTLWKTLVAEERGFVMPLILAGALGFMMYSAYKAEKIYLVVLGAVLLLVQAFGTFYIRDVTAEMVFTFGGDGIGMVLAVMLMATFFFGKRTQLYKGWLRWGFLVIGAAAFSDMFATWWAARNDIGKIPYGEIEGVGLSDSAKLVELHGWSVQMLVRRFLTVGFACLAALAAVYAWGVWAAWRKAKEFS